MRTVAGMNGLGNRSCEFITTPKSNATASPASHQLQRHRAFRRYAGLSQPFEIGQFTEIKISTARRRERCLWFIQDIEPITAKAIQQEGQKRFAV
jgi:hypothetical protein